MLLTRVGLCGSCREIRYAGHLLVAGIWLGGLPWLALLLTWERRTQAASTAPDVTAVIQRHFVLGRRSAFLLLLTGTIQACWLVGSVPALLGTPYGQLLLAKVPLFPLLVGLLAGNGWRAFAHQRRLDGAARRQPYQALIHRLERQVWLAVLLGLAMLGLGGVLAMSPPGRAVVTHWPWPVRLRWAALQDTPDLWTPGLQGGLLVVAGLLALACPQAQWFTDQRPIR